jgi:hypothetical protein
MKKEENESMNPDRA